MIEKGKVFPLNMLVVHPRDVTPEIILWGKIAGIERIALTRVPIKI